MSDECENCGDYAKKNNIEILETGWCKHCSEIFCDEGDKDGI